MKSEGRNPKIKRTTVSFRHSSFVIHFVIRHSSFVIPHP